MIVSPSIRSFRSSAQRGLTLVEVLAASVLLVFLAAVCIPLVQGISQHLPRETSQVDFIDLHHAADAFMDNPAAFGVDTLSDRSVFTITVSISPAFDQIAVQRVALENKVVEGNDEDPQNALQWLVYQFRVDHNEVIRFALEPREEQDE